MSKAEALLLRAHECEEDAALATTKQSKRRLKQIADGWRTVSKDQAWLDGEVTPMGNEQEFCSRSASIYVSALGADRAIKF